MSRSGYSDDGGDYPLALYRNAVDRSLMGKRGQACLRDLLAALEALPERRLIANELRAPDGQVCALGALGVARGIDLTKIDPEDPRSVGAAFGIAWSMAAEIEDINDEVNDYYHKRTPENRYEDVVAWVKSQIKTS